MAQRLSMAELESKLLDPDMGDAELKRYFTADSDPDHPFSINLRIDESKVAVNTAIADAAKRSAALLNMANNVARMKRQMLFNRRLADGYDGPIIVSEGDSWFQYPIMLKDTIDHLLDRFAIRSLDAAGDLMRDIERADEYSRAIADTKADIFLLSGGGNDLLASGNLANHLRPYFPGAQAADLLLPSFDSLVGSVVAAYRRIFEKLGKRFPKLSILCHGYDLPMPVKKGQWLGKPLASRHIDDPALQREMLALMMNRFNVELAKAAAGSSRVHYVDGRGKVGKRWHDELHPTDAGFADIAAGFAAVIDGVGRPRAPTRSRGAAAARGGATATRSAIKARSLHIGLNFVDADHYQGWDGALSACEFDAEDMAGIAASRGFKSTSLLTNAATREAVSKAIRDAADELGAGDIFFLSYAGHGGQLPDYSGDEEDRRDETWCLYDGELIDDELFQLWTEFAAGVRILVISDSCHSGSVTRMALSASGGDGSAVLAGQGRRVRAMPPGVAGRVYRSNRAFYDRVAAAVRVDERGAATRSSQVKATVRLISACQDNQLAGDGLANGRFTEELLKVWAEGAFTGSYVDFHRAILKGMPPDQSPNHYAFGAPNPAYDAQTPFAI